MHLNPCRMATMITETGSCCDPSSQMDFIYYIGATKWNFYSSEAICSLVDLTLSSLSIPQLYFKALMYSIASTYIQTVLAQNQES